MPWTEFEEARLLDAFWCDGAAYCPDPQCQALLKASLFPTREGPFLELNLACPGCNAFVRFTEENDRHRATYRDWNQSEREAMLRSALNEQPVFCPVDNARCQVTYNAAVRGTAAPTPGTAVTCFRCGREFNLPS